MRKAIFLLFLLLGIGAGYRSASGGDWGLRTVMMAVGALFGGAIGGGLSRIPMRHARNRHWRTEDEIEPIPGMGTSSRDLAANYWRDEGHPPLMKSPQAAHGPRMLDANKNI